ncbi:Diamine acetyltransferase 2 [Halocaridina rubra]|uniref:Diamine acetyltransferase 2 n=1 Tax=Halocaridina rubra TaxID=373956 RepID=A0AAN8WHR9_HALRR
MSETTIREAKISDCDSLVSMMKEATDEMNFGTKLKLTAKDLEKDAFGKSPNFGIYVCQSAACDIVGYVLFYYTYSTWEGRSVCIEEMFVSPSHRRKGLASALWRRVVQTALQNDCKRCNLTALPGNEFLLSQGAFDLSVLEGWLFFRQTKEAMELFVKSCQVPGGVLIREAGRNNCKTIRKMIQDLADYEKMPEGPKLSAATLEEDGHGETKFYRCFIAENDRALLGYTLFFFTYNAEGHGVYMEDIYVSPEYRGRGIGLALWGKVIQAGLDLGGTRCDFAVLDWNIPSIDIYKTKGAVDMTEASNFHFYRMTREVMEKFAKC